METKFRKYWTLIIGGAVLSIMLLASGCVVSPGYYGPPHGSVTVRTWNGPGYHGGPRYHGHRYGYYGYGYRSYRHWH